jgi:hypothetical protein
MSALPIDAIKIGSRFRQDHGDIGALALRLFAASPEHFSRKKDHGRAEAALLAVYGASLDLGGRASISPQTEQGEIE